MLIPALALLTLIVRPEYVAILAFLVAILHPRSRSVSLLSALLLLSTRLGLPTPIVGASMFVLIGREFRGGVLRNIAVYTLLGLAFFHVFDILRGLGWSLEYEVFLSLTGGLTASLIESVGGDELLLTLAVATVYTIFNIYAISVPLHQLGLAFALAFVLSLLATKSGVADESGLLSATLIGTLTIVFSDIRYFVILLLFYGIGSAVTKYKYSVKLERGIAEQAGGARGYVNVFSNSLPALFFVMNYGITKDPSFATAFVASVACALGDTMASEVGKTADRVYLITNFKPVEPGVSGGISAVGEISALLGCAIVSGVAVILGVVDLFSAIVALVASFVGVHVDSLLGATLEKKGYLTNAGVNFFGVLSSGVLAYLLLRTIR